MVIEAGGLTQWPQPSLSTSVLKPSDIRGASSSSERFRPGRVHYLGTPLPPDRARQTRGWQSASPAPPYFDFFGARFLGPDRFDGAASSPWHGQESLKASKASVMPGTSNRSGFGRGTATEPWHFPKCYLAPEGMLAHQRAGLVKSTSQSRSFLRMRRQTVPRRNRGTSLQQVARNISARPLLYPQLCRWPFQ